MQRNTDMVEKLNNHRLPIDESYWAEMEERLQKKRKKVVPFWMWFTGTGIAASLALLLTVRIFDVENENIGTQMTQITQISTDEVKPIQSASSLFEEGERTANNEQTVGTRMTQITQVSSDEVKSTQSASSSFKEEEKIASNKQTVGTQMAQITQIPADHTTNENFKQKKSVSSASSVFKENVSPVHEGYEITGNDTSTNNIAQTGQDTIPEKQNELKFQYDDWLLAQDEPEFKKEKTQHKKSWQIAAAFSSSASNSSNSDFAFLDSKNKENYSFENSKDVALLIPPMFSPNGDLSSDRDPTVDDVFRQFPEVTHLPPLSVGVTVRKNFNKYLAIETGFTYSFLQSKFKENSEWRHRDATLKLHYLGIPLNAVTYLLNKPQWNVYFSLGGMMEKGIVQDYVQHTTYKYPYLYDNQPVHSISLQDDIPGLQWSVNTSFGINYKIYRNIGIYFEPRIIYYFKNNQPVSVRTETPLLVGLNAGLRFEF